MMAGEWYGGERAGWMEGCDRAVWVPKGRMGVGNGGLV